MSGWRALVLAPLLAVLVGCGGNDAPRASPTTADPDTCRQQWAGLGQTVVGLDEDTHPSALAGRWTTVIATLDYYANAATAKDCEDRLTQQQSDIDALRRLTDQLRPFDMGYQYEQVRAGIDLYLHDPLPAPARDDNGKLVPPPRKGAVITAYRALGAGATQADTDLAPAWQQVEKTSLTDATALRSAIENLDAFARASSSWRGCEAALQVLVAAIRAQESSG